MPMGYCTLKKWCLTDQVLTLDDCSSIGVSTEYLGNIRDITTTFSTGLTILEAPFRHHAFSWFAAQRENWIIFSYSVQKETEEGRAFCVVCMLFVVTWSDKTSWTVNYLLTACVPLYYSPNCIQRNFLLYSTHCMCSSLPAKPWWHDLENWHSYYVKLQSALEEILKHNALIVCNQRGRGKKFWKQWSRGTQDTCHAKTWRFDHSHIFKFYDLPT